MRGLLFEADSIVADWAFRTHKFHPMKFDKAVGIVDRGDLVGAIIWQNYNGFNIDFSYYGHNTATLGIMRSVAQHTLKVFNPTRVTIMTPKTNKSLIRFLTRIGGRFEGAMRNYYGERGASSIAVRFMFPRSTVETLAQMDKVKRAAS